MTPESDSAGRTGREDPGAEEAVPSVVRHEEELRTRVLSQEAGSVRARTIVETGRAWQDVDRGVEQAEIERGEPSGADSGEIETLPDGSVSIPLFEEELVITKRLVVRERVIIRKRTVIEHERVEADLRRERVEIDADPQVQDRVDDAVPGSD